MRKAIARYGVLVAGSVLIGLLAWGPRAGNPTPQRGSPASGSVPAAEDLGAPSTPTKSHSLRAEASDVRGTAPKDLGSAPEAEPILGCPAQDLMARQTPPERKIELIDSFSKQGGAVAAEVLYQAVRRHRSLSDRAVWGSALERLASAEGSHARNRVDVLLQDTVDERHVEMVRIVEMARCGGNR